MEEKIKELETKIKSLEKKIEDLEGIICIGCKSKYGYQLLLCESCEHPVCYSCIDNHLICPRKICQTIYQMSTNTETD